MTGPAGCTVSVLCGFLISSEYVVALNHLPLCPAGQQDLRAF